MSTEAKARANSSTMLGIETLAAKDRDLVERASYAGLEGRGVTPQALALVEALLPHVEAVEARGADASGATRYKRNGKRTEALKTAIEGLICDLLRAACTGNPWVHRAISKRHFVDTSTSYLSLKAAIKALEASGLLVEITGTQSYNPANEFSPARQNRGYASRFKATGSLIKLARKHGIKVEDAPQHFHLPLPANPLRLRARSTKTDYGEPNLRGALIENYHRSQRTECLEAEVRKINDFLKAIRISGGTHSGFVRNFSNGNNTPSYCWDQGGRLQSYGGGSYMVLGAPKRLKMTFDGEPVCEIDVRAAYLTIFHGLCGVPFDISRDPYAISHIPRAVVKAWMTATFGLGKPISRWPPETAKHLAGLKELKGKSLGRMYPVKKVAEAMMAKHPVLERWGVSNYTWADLMFRESEALVRTKINLIDSGRVPSLSVHDCIIVPAKHWEVAARLFRSNYQEQCGISPRLTVEFAPGLKRSKVLYPTTM